MMSKITPDMRNQIENIYKMGIQGGNPEQFFMQRFGNDPAFQKALNVVRGKTPEEFNNYLGNLYKTLGGN